MGYSIETRCQHLEEDNSRQECFGAVSYPIYQTATFAHWGVGKSTGYDYSRSQNPTREHLEKVMAGLEKGSHAIAFSSGLAAITALMELFQPGDHLIMDEDLYGGSIRLFQSISAKNGIRFTKVDCSSKDISRFITKNTKAVFIETPTNPMMNVIDIVKLSEIVRKEKLLLIVDNTFLSPYLQNPLELGADIVVHSGTKYLGGHNDTLAGFLVTDQDEIGEKLRVISKTTGAVLSPFDAFLVERGIKTLAVRMERAERNAQELAHYLKKHPHVRKVVYPGFMEHPGYEIMKKQARGFGAMITFEVDSVQMVHGLLEHLQLVKFAESLGGTETLITYPIVQTHADVSEDELKQNGITDCILRLSVGIEGIEDLVQDFEYAFNYYKY